METTLTQVLELPDDMTQLTEAQMEWLHDLKTLAQKMKIAMFYKSEGIDNAMGGK